VGRGAVVVGLARGGVEVAAPVAEALQSPLDALAVRKVGHPARPELALGAVAPGGGLYLRAEDGVRPEQLAEAIEAARAAALRLDAYLHAGRPRVRIAGRAVVVVDDGLATGATMIAALRWARGEGAARTIAAVPVAAGTSIALVKPEADELVCLAVPPGFRAVGPWYRRFGQLGDEDVLRLLSEQPSS
jgi:predicted phosphoribosyltransferase